MGLGQGDGVVIIVLISEGWVQGSRDKAAHHLDRRTHSEPPRHCLGYLGVQPHKEHSATLPRVWDI